MKIVCIFVHRLYAVVFPDQNGKHELARNVDHWNDLKYLWDFAAENNIENKNKWVDDISSDLEEIEDFFENVEFNEEPLEHFFQPLHNNEYGFHVLSRQKGKFRQNKLRLYAIKVDNDCYVITGGAIKMSHLMEGHPETSKELPKIERVRSFLKDQGITDLEGLNDLLNDQ